MFFFPQLKSNDQKNISKWITQKFNTMKIFTVVLSIHKRFQYGSKTIWFMHKCISMTNSFESNQIAVAPRIQRAFKMQKKPHTYKQYCVNECDEIASGTMQLITGTGCRNCTKLNHRFFFDFDHFCAHNLFFSFKYLFLPNISSFY